MNEGSLCTLRFAGTVISLALWEQCPNVKRNSTKVSVHLPSALVYRCLAWDIYDIWTGWQGHSKKKYIKISIKQTNKKLEKNQSARIRRDLCHYLLIHSVWCAVFACAVHLPHLLSCTRAGNTDAAIHWQGLTTEMVLIVFLYWTEGCFPEPNQFVCRIAMPCCWLRAKVTRA